MLRILLLCFADASLLTLLSCGVQADDQQTVIDLGGIRKVQAKIAVEKSSYLVEVTMRPVRAFDAPTNDEVNQEIGREYGLRALGKFISNGQDVQFSSGGEQVVEVGMKEDRFRMVMRWSKDRISLVKEDEKNEPKPGIIRIKKDAFQGKLFTAKHDHLNTLAALSEIYRRALAAAIGHAGKADPEERRKLLNKAIASLEERGLAEFDRLQIAIVEDENLIDITERPELLSAVKLQRERFLDELRNAAKANPPAFDQFSNVQVKKPFDEYLTANPLLMEVAGAVIIDLGPDRKVFIGIAKTILKDDSPEELLRAEKVCPIKAKTAIIGERDGAQITYLKRIKDHIEIVKDADGEKSISTSERTKLTEERIQGIAKDMPVVGRWRSKNGKVFYMAVGTIVDAKGQAIAP